MNENVLITYYSSMTAFYDPGADQIGLSAVKVKNKAFHFCF